MKHKTAESVQEGDPRLPQERKIKVGVFPPDDNVIATWPIPDIILRVGLDVVSMKSLR